MTNTLFDYDNHLVQDRIDDLRRDAARARFARVARQRRRERRNGSQVGGPARPTATR